MLRGVASDRGSLGIPFVLAASAATGMSTTGDTNENTLATITVPGGAIGANGIVRITLQFSYTNSANTKTLRVRFGGTNFASFTTTTTASNRHQVQIQNRNSASSQVGGSAAAAFGGSSGAAVTASVNTESNVTILITAQNGLGTETITLESYMVEIIPG